MLSLQKNLPPMAIALQQRWHCNHPTLTTITYPDKLKITLLSNQATLPTKATPHSASYDMYSAESIVIAASSQTLICSNVSMEIPPQHFGLRKSRSGLAMKHNIHVQAGIIHCDYRGDITILLVNESDTDFQVTTCIRIAQLIILHTPNIEIELTQNLSKTERDTKGFGSTGTHEIITKHNTAEHDQSTPHAAAATPVGSDIPDDNIIPYNVICSDYPFTAFKSITIHVCGKHISQGLILKECPYFKDKVVITSVQTGSLPRNIKK